MSNNNRHIIRGAPFKNIQKYRSAQPSHNSRTTLLDLFSIL